MGSDIDSSELRRVVELNEAAKALLRQSFEINLRALDAIVQSKRGGGALRGFDEVSSQIRLWSRDLQEKVESLWALGRSAVTSASHLLQTRRVEAILERAVAGKRDTWAGRSLEASSQVVAGHLAELKAAWRRILDAVDDLNQLGLMACVLSRSALIEASTATDGEREKLVNVSRDFYKKSEEVVGIVQTLGKSLRRARA